MRKLIFLLLSLISCFSSCSKQEDEVGGETPAPPFTSEALPSDNSHADFIATTKDGKTLYFKITSPSTCEVTYNGDYSATENYVVGSLTVPSHVNYQGEKLEVTGIGKKAFYRCKNLGGVLLPTTIKKIGDNAFDECENLSSINIPDAVIEIGQGAFNDTGLASISFPNGIKNVSLSGCSKLSSLRLPDNLERLYLSECAFIPSLSIPEGVKSIYLFSCEGLETINIPQGVTELFLKRCSGINHHIEIPNGVGTISEDAFEGCRSLPSVTIPDKIKYIGKGAFDGCTSLSYVVYKGHVYDGYSLLNSYLRRDGIASYNVFPEDAFTGKHESDNNGNANSHEYVDLGLKDSFGRTVYWATCNIGAERPEDFGLYFAWGDTKGYGKDVNDGHIFDWSSYKWCKGDSMSITKYCFNNSYGVVDYKMILDLEDDAAHVNWGGGWHIPTKMEQTQLINECTWRWTSVNGVNGHEVKGPNGNSIFLPAAGLRTENEIYSCGVSGWYSSSLLDQPNHIFSIIIRQGGSKGINSSSRTNGRTIRPVLH